MMDGCSFRIRRVRCYTTLSCNHLNKYNSSLLTKMINSGGRLLTKKTAIISTTLIIQICPPSSKFALPLSYTINTQRHLSKLGGSRCLKATVDKMRELSLLKNSNNTLNSNNSKNNYRNKITSKNLTRYSLVVKYKSKIHQNDRYNKF